MSYLQASRTHASSCQRNVAECSMHLPLAMVAGGMHKPLGSSRHSTCCIYFWPWHVMISRLTVTVAASPQGWADFATLAYYIDNTVMVTDACKSYVCTSTTTMTFHSKAACRHPFYYAAMHHSWKLQPTVSCCSHTEHAFLYACSVHICIHLYAYALTCIYLMVYLRRQVLCQH